MKIIPFFTKLNTTFPGAALLILRIFSGGLMVPHGWNKMMHYAEKSGKFLDFMGLGPEISMALVIFAEFFCALFLVVGLGTRLVLIPLMIAMLVAVFDAHDGEIFGEGQEAFLYFITYLTLFLSGPGKYALDQKILIG
jgi:putative oxidoreductase